MATRTITLKPTIAPDMSTVHRPAPGAGTIVGSFEWPADLVRSAILVAMYFVVGLWGFVFTPDEYGIPLVWPATGVGLAFVYLYGYRMVPAVGIGAAAVTFLLINTKMAPVESVLSVAATMASVALGAALLRKFGFSPHLARLRDIGLLVLVGGTISSGVNAIVGSYRMAVSMDAVLFGDIWWLCWAADLMGLILVAPVLLTVLAGTGFGHGDQWRGPSVGILLGVVAVTGIVYSGQVPMGMGMPLSYAVFPLVMLAAARCPIPVTATAILLAGGIALSATGSGLGPFAEMGLSNSLLSLNAHLGLLVLTGLVIAAMRAEREDAERRARLHLEELAHAGRLSSLGELSAGLAHELNQPLFALANYAQASRRLLEGGDTRRLRETLQRIDANAHRAAETVRQMRAFAAHQAPERKRVPPARLVRDVAELIKPALHRNRVRMRLDIPQDLPGVSVAEVQIEQVLLNLLRNAIDATTGADPAVVEVRLRVLPDHEMLEVRVLDTGCGIPDDRMDHLFDAFTTWKEGGLGLGLSISRSLIEAHGGTLTAANRDEGGAVFTFTLPLGGDTHD